MRFSLLDRFTGGLLGYLLGITLQEDRLQLPESESQLSPWLRILIFIVNRLLKSSALQLEDWKKIDEQYGDELQLKGGANSDMIALITTPLGLFFHDHPYRLQEQLNDCQQTWAQSSESLESVLIWHQVIGLLLREKIQPSRLIEQFLALVSQRKSRLNPQIDEVNSWLEGKIATKTLISQLSLSSQPDLIPIFLACYYFSQTPDDFRLCVLRAQKSPVQPLRTTGLTAILAGVYNSWSGIPIEWRLELQDYQTAQIIHQQAIKLLALWSGVIQTIDLNLISGVAIASPKVIQERACLKIISQQNF